MEDVREYCPHMWIKYNTYVYIYLYRKSWCLSRTVWGIGLKIHLWHLQQLFFCLAQNPCFVLRAVPHNCPFSQHFTVHVFLKSAPDQPTSAFWDSVNVPMKKSTLSKLCNSVFTRWWFHIFLIFTPNVWDFMIQCDFRIFFKMGLVKNHHQLVTY